MEATSDREPNDVVVSPRTRLHGELRLPGDKSISHRAAMIAALAHGKSAFENFSSAQDCEATLDCLRQLGISIVKEGSTVGIEGVGPGRLLEPEQDLNAGNSGTTMRLLAGLLAGQPFSSTITGDESLLRRPMLRLAEPLRLMGATVELGPNNCGPIRIKGQLPLTPITYRPAIASAQIKSAVLLAALSGRSSAIVEEPVKTRNHTELLLEEFGQVKQSVNSVSVDGQRALLSAELIIPGDISAAAFFIAAAIALPGSEILIHEVGLNPTRTGFMSKLTELGASIEFPQKRLRHNEIVGTIQVSGVPLQSKLPIVVRGDEVAGLIDELPLLAFLAASIGCGMELRDAGQLRVKESDRIAATVENLIRMGAAIVADDDGWTLQPGSKLRGAQLDSFGDHRIAMSCAVAALAADGASEIKGGKSAVAISLPEFWSLLESVSE